MCVDVAIKSDKSSSSHLSSHFPLLDHSTCSIMNRTHQSDRELSHRLPTTIVPSHYRLYIDASQLEEYLFQGIVDIDLDV